MIASDHKAHADFIRNDTGDSSQRIMALLLHVPLLIVLNGFIVSRMQHTSSLWNALLVEFALFTCPILLMMTSLAEHVTSSSLLLCCLTFCTWLSSKWQKSQGKRRAPKSFDGSGPLYSSLFEKERVFVSWFKGAVVLVTSIAILAVDFPVFPRTSAKSNKFGMSLMDLGAVYSVVSTALTSSWSQGSGDYHEENHSRGLLLRRHGDKKKVNLFKQVWVAPVLGASRLITIKFLNYPEIVDEYGIHWNFFMTLTGIWLMRNITHRLFSFSSIQLAIIACCIIIGYQWALLNTNLTTFIFDAERGDSFLAANREGIIAMAMGYFPIFLLIEAFSREIIFGTDRVLTAKQKKGEIRASELGVPRERQLIILAYLTAISWVLWYLCHTFIQGTSRRLLNASFVLFSLASAFAILGSLLLAEDVVRAHVDGDEGNGIFRVCCGLQLANKFSLELFLFANLCTGVVNMMCATHGQNNISACLLLAAYSLLLHFFPALVLVLQD